MKKTYPSSKDMEQWRKSLDLSAFFPTGQGRDKALYAAASHRDIPYRLMVGDGFRCCEYHLSLNIFTFGKASLRLPFTIIGPPASVDQTGYYGSLEKLANHYKTKKGNYLVLNLHAPWDECGTCARTLSTAVLINKFKNVDDYIGALRSSYRRKIRLAKEQIADLSWEPIPGRDFDESLYRLYLQVLAKSDFPLETLELNFFRTCPGEIFVLWEDGQPLAFVLLEHQKEQTTFLFGGMDYEKRDARDLYMNMLLKVVEEGIGNGSKEIHLGQTAEESKCRIGAVLVPRYMLFLSSNRLMTVLARVLMKHLAYREGIQPHHVFRQIS